MAYTTINKSTDYFNTKLYTGNGSARSITGVGFQPDWCWFKNRSTTNGHSIFDAVRGATKNIISNSTGAESTSSNGLTAFDSDGFSIGTDGDVNGNGNNIVSWNWKANGQGSSNTDGTINSTYTSANTTSGFSIVQYTGNGVSGATVGHGLGSAPKMVIIKNLGSVKDWRVGHDGLTSWAYRLHLNETAAQAEQSAIFNSTAPTSTVFSIGNNSSVNESGVNHVAYCFAEKTGYSKFGSYTGNGLADGTFVYTGFKPAFVLIKNSSNAGLMWNIRDNKRDTLNPNNTVLYPNSNEAENAHGANDVDWLSNGFKMRTTNGHTNASGNTYIFMAFGQSLVGSNNVPCTAR